MDQPIAIANITTLVPANSETTVVEYFTPSSKQCKIIGFTVSGDTTAIFNFYINGTKILVSRINPVNLIVQVNGLYCFPIAEDGQQCVIKVIHYADGVAGNFEATLLGQLYG